MSTRSPTTIRRLGDSSGMGSSIHGHGSWEGGRWGLPKRLRPFVAQGGPTDLPYGGKGDVDHVPRLTGPGAALLMRPCRSGSRGPHSSPFGRDNRHAKPGAVELDPADRVGLDLGK